MKFCVVCSRGLGDAIIMHIASHHLKLAGHEVVTVTPHTFGQWFDGYQFSPELVDCDAIFLQTDRTERTLQIRNNHPNVYSFIGTRKFPGPILPKKDFIADPNRPIVENIIKALKAFFDINATAENGLKPPRGLIYKKFAKRLVIHTSSGSSDRNWSQEKFDKIADWARSNGLEPAYLPLFKSLDDLFSFIYESGLFLGNDSGPGHIAAYLNIPYVIIGKSERSLRHWRPGWGNGYVITPSRWIPNIKILKLRENWQRWITASAVIQKVRYLLHSNF